MLLTPKDFEAFHLAVHGKAPFAWQSRLLQQVVSERAWPRVLDLPTGAGKTTCLDIALFALALDAQAPQERWCPRRIAMVVDRRIVVDQVAERGRKLQRALTQEDTRPVVAEVARLLRGLSKEAAEPLGVFTLRGGMPKDDGWARTPDQPLILASTVDQLGSRLLVQGYGVSQGMKPVHAGLVANDLLLLLDEVHLSRPFAETLDALDALRSKFARTSGLTPRFHHAFLSATPGTTSRPPFRLTDEERAPGSALGPRLHAKKPARLVEVQGRTALEKACVDAARAAVERHDVVAVVLNRLASAATTTRQIRESIGGRAEVVLLTGRMRPLDRDDVVGQLRGRIATGRDRSAVGKKLVVVGTQCIEAGADFDFDALVTESASLDALRQRFGRVDRLGLYERSEGVIVHDQSAREDPIYGAALAATVGWLKKQLTKKANTIDFGVLALAVPTGEQLEPLLPPPKQAPVLLPAYMDLWMQTSPAPAVVPDIGLWLHGPESGPADVQVVWRADVSEEELGRAYAAADRNAASQRLTSVVAAVKPSGLEAMSLPYAAAKRWLSGQEGAEVVDVEGSPEGAEAVGGVRPLLLWRGPDSVVAGPADVRPGDTVVVPATRGGIVDGCFAPESRTPVKDLAERAALFGRGQPVLRLHPGVLAQLGMHLPIEEVDDARAVLEEMAAEAEPGSWRRVWLEALARSSASIVVDGEPTWTVLQGRRVSNRVLRALLQPDVTLEDGVELTTDEDDSFHAGKPVPLSTHSADVEHFARLYAAGAGLPAALVEDVALAGWLHDVGKADRRFQVLLRGGSLVDFFKDETPLAKSGLPPAAKAAHRIAQRKSGYPSGARHEVQSVQMLEHCRAQLQEKAHDLDLVLHLVASHHGYCRPFAPPVVDERPVQVSLAEHRSEVFGTLELGPCTSDHGLHRLDSPVGERFWRLVERYGWQELCWLEAILRLADHRASEMEMGGAA